jgi:hypothetical protein
VPAKPEDTHVPWGNANLKDSMCLEYGRTVANNYVIRFETRLFQILGSNKILPRPKDKVTVRIGLDGKLTVLFKKNKRLVKELTNIQIHKPKKAA